MSCPFIPDACIFIQMQAIFTATTLEKHYNCERTVSKKVSACFSGLSPGTGLAGPWLKLSPVGHQSQIPWQLFTLIPFHARPPTLLVLSHTHTPPVTPHDRASVFRRRTQALGSASGGTCRFGGHCCSRPRAPPSSPVSRVNPAGGFGGVVDVVDFAVIVASVFPALGQGQLLPGHLLLAAAGEQTKATAAAPCKELSNPLPLPSSWHGGLGGGGAGRAGHSHPLALAESETSRWGGRRYPSWSLGQVAPAATAATEASLRTPWPLQPQVPRARGRGSGACF